MKTSGKKTPVNPDNIPKFRGIVAINKTTKANSGRPAAQRISTNIKSTAVTANKTKDIGMATQIATNHSINPMIKPKAPPIMPSGSTKR